jgi:hypothetical protein
VQGEGCQHRVDDKGTGPLSGGLERLFRLLRNTGSVGLPDPLGAVAAPVCSLAAVENRSPSQGSPNWTWGAFRTGE